MCFKIRVKCRESYVSRFLWVFFFFEIFPKREEDNDIWGICYYCFNLFKKYFLFLYLALGGKLLEK
jgi:hypothetical protein